MMYTTYVFFSMEHGDDVENDLFVFDDSDLMATMISMMVIF